MHNSDVVSAADVVQSPAYNPASPQYELQVDNTGPLTARRRSKFLQPHKNEIKEEVRDNGKMNMLCYTNCAIMKL